jgi:hypothetical protein
VRQGVIRGWDGSADLAIPIGNCMKKQQVKIFQSVSTMLHQHDMGATQYDQVSRFACDAHNNNSVSAGAKNRPNYMFPPQKIYNIELPGAYS